MNFYLDEDGVSVECESKKFGCFVMTYMDMKEEDNYFFDKIKNFVNDSDIIFNSVTKAIKKYSSEKYSYNKEYLFQLMTVYISQTSDEYGMLFNWEGDPEHGIGVKMQDHNVTKIGSAEVSFS